MKKEIEINMAWTVWNLLENLKDKIWEQYEKDFLEIIMSEDEMTFFKQRADDFIPF